MRFKKRIDFPEPVVDPALGVSIQFNPDDRECEIWVNFHEGVLIFGLTALELGLFNRQVADRLSTMIDIGTKTFSKAVFEGAATQVTSLETLQKEKVKKAMEAPAPAPIVPGDMVDDDNSVSVGRVLE